MFVLPYYMYFHYYYRLCYVINFDYVSPTILCCDANKNIKKIIQKMVVTYKDWHEMLPFALHGYGTFVLTSTGATPFSLVYGMEVVLPVEVEIPSMRVLMEAKSTEAEWVRSRYDQLNLIEEKRLTAMCHE